MPKKGETTKSRATAAAPARENAKIPRENSKASRDRTSAARAESVALAKENLLVAPDHAALRHDHSRSPEKQFDTESETDSSAKTTPVKKQTQAELAREIFKSEIDGDRNHLPEDLELVDLKQYVEEMQEGDRKLNQGDRMKLILGLRTSI